MASKQSNLVDIGRIGTVFGVKGWVKVQSFTEPADNILNYSPWWLKTRHGVKSVEIDEGKPHGPGYVVHIKGLDDREEAEQYRNVTIAIERSQLQDLDDGEYYWSQLIGLRVISQYEDSTYDFGTVQRLIETGANDVLVVQGDSDSIDTNERLVPYVPGEFIIDIDLAAGVINVSWDPSF